MATHVDQEASSDESRQLVEERTVLGAKAEEGGACTPCEQAGDTPSRSSGCALIGRNVNLMSGRCRGYAREPVVGVGARTPQDLGMP